MDKKSVGSALFSIRERELLCCPDTPEHTAVCLKDFTRRMQQLGFQIPDSLRAQQRVACMAVLLEHETDVLFTLKLLLDDYERLRKERDDLRFTDKQQRHELGRLSRRSGSLERQLVKKEKNLADTEYRLEEQRRLADCLRAEVKHEAQKARLAQSGMRRLEDQVKHRQQRTERELFEAKQRLERSDLGPQTPSKPAVLSRRSRPLHPWDRTRPETGGAAAAATEWREPVARNAVLTSDFFNTVQLPPLQTRGRRQRNRSVPTAQVWYKVPAAPRTPDPDAEEAEDSVISLAETIDASGVAGSSGDRCEDIAHSDATFSMSKKLQNRR